MREQKYKDILEKYEEMNKETDTKDLEEKLSMTRELKFKDLQESLKNEEEESEVDLSMTREMKFLNKVKETDTLIGDEDDENDDESAEIDKEHTLIESADIERELDEAIDREIERNKKIKVKEVKESEEVKSNKIDDDIYLTTSFKPFKKRFRFRKVFKVLFILLILVGGVGALTYYVGLPVYYKIIDSRPKVIFDHAIDYAGKELKKISDTLYEDDNNMYTDFSFSNNGSAERIGVRNILQANGGLKELFLYAEDGTEESGMSYRYDDDNKYVNFADSTNNINLNSLSKDENVLDNGLLKYFDNAIFSKEDLDYVLNKEIDILKELIESNLIKSSKEELEVGGKTIKTTRHSFTLDKKNAERLSKKYYELVNKDSKLVKILAKISNKSNNEYLAYLKEKVNKELEKDFKLVFSIYMRKGTEFVGFDLEGNGFRSIYYYKNENNFDAYVNMDNICGLIGKKCSLKNKKVLELEGREKNNRTEVLLKYNSKNILKLDVKEDTFEKALFDYEVYIKDKTIEGNVDIELDKDKKEGTATLLIKIDGKTNNIKYYFDFNKKESKIKVLEDNSVMFTEKNFDNQYDNFVKSLDNEETQTNFEIMWSMLFYPQDTIKEIFSK